MPRNTNIEQVQKNSTGAKGQRTTALQRPRRKTPGTRLGILRDWREGSSKSGKTSVGISKTVRDGR